jgi:hypothetical protein
MKNKQWSLLNRGWSEGVEARDPTIVPADTLHPKPGSALYFFSNLYGIVEIAELRKLNSSGTFS